MNLWRMLELPSMARQLRGSSLVEVDIQLGFGERPRLLPIAVEHVLVERSVLDWWKSPGNLGGKGARRSYRHVQDQCPEI